MINENLEIEYKTMVTKKQLKRLLKYYPRNNFVKQTNYYYRGSSSDLTFRFREKDGTWLFTNKQHSSDGRLEKEKLFSSLVLDDPEILNYLKSLGCNPPFTCIASLTTARCEVLLENEAHLCFDMNKYGAKKDYEIEYEICGSKGNLQMFKCILKLAGITYRKSPLSKSARAINLANRKLR